MHVIQCKVYEHKHYKKPRKVGIRLKPLNYKFDKVEDNTCDLLLHENIHPSIFFTFLYLAFKLIFTSSTICHPGLDQQFEKHEYISGERFLNDHNISYIKGPLLPFRLTKIAP